jgi:hypothetical protein
LDPGDLARRFDIRPNDATLALVREVEQRLGQPIRLAEIPPSGPVAVVQYAPVPTIHLRPGVARDGAFAHELLHLDFHSLSANDQHCRRRS